MSDIETQFNRLPEENAKEARRLVKSLETRLKEIRQQAEVVQLADARKKLENLQNGNV